MISTENSLPEIPSNALIVSWAELGTGSITYYASRDNGTTYTQILMTEIGTESGSVKIYKGYSTISSQPSGISGRVRVNITGNAELYAWGALFD